MPPIPLAIRLDVMMIYHKIVMKLAMQVVSYVSVTGV